MSAVLRYFEENLPRHLYHANDLTSDLRISGKGCVFLVRYIQQDQPRAQFWLVPDADREGVATDWNDRNTPVPNITVRNPMNGYVHLLYALNIAVRTALDASVKALKYVVAVEHSLYEKLCADVSYNGLIYKNPFHLERLMMGWHEEAYALGEPADYPDLSALACRSIDKYYGMGRNCHLFEMTCKWAYRAIRQDWPEFSQWLDAVTQHVETYNVSLPVLFSPAECRTIDRSIVKYTHRKFSSEGFSAVQAACDRKGGIAKGEACEDKCFMALCTLESGYSQKAVTAMLNVHCNTTRNWAMYK